MRTRGRGLLACGDRGQKHGLKLGHAAALLDVLGGERRTVMLRPEAADGGNPGALGDLRRQAYRFRVHFGTGFLARGLDGSFHHVLL